MTTSFIVARLLLPQLPLQDRTDTLGAGCDLWTLTKFFGPLSGHFGRFSVSDVFELSAFSDFGPWLSLYSSLQ